MKNSLKLPSQDEYQAARTKFEEEGDFDAVPEILERCYQYWIHEAENSVDEKLKKTIAAWKTNQVDNTAVNRGKAKDIIQKSCRLAGIQAFIHATQLSSFYRILAPVDQTHREKLSKWTEIAGKLRKRYKPSEL